MARMSATHHYFGRIRDDDPFIRLRRKEVNGALVSRAIYAPGPPFSEPIGITPSLLKVIDGLIPIDEKLDEFERGARDAIAMNFHTEFDDWLESRLAEREPRAALRRLFPECENISDFDGWEIAKALRLEAVMYEIPSTDDPAHKVGFDFTLKEVDPEYIFVAQTDATGAVFELSMEN